MKDNDKLAMLYKCKGGYEQNCYVATGDTININGILNVVNVLDAYHIRFDKFCNGMCLHTHQFSNLEGLDFYFLPNYKFHNLLRETFNQMRTLVFKKFEIRLGRIEESQEEKELVLKELSDKILGTEPCYSYLEAISQIGLESFIVERLLSYLKLKNER